MPVTGLDAYDLCGLKLQFDFVDTATAGRNVRAGDMCVVKYCGRLGGHGGAVFDESAEDSALQVSAGRGKVIAAWDLALCHMVVGQRALLEAPPVLAYGRKGRPPKIPPNSTLFFELTVLEVIDTPNERLLDGAAQVSTIMVAVDVVVAVVAVAAAAASL